MALLLALYGGQQSYLFLFQQLFLRSSCSQRVLQSQTRPCTTPAFRSQTSRLLVSGGCCSSARPHRFSPRKQTRPFASALAPRRQLRDRRVATSCFALAVRR